MGEVVGVAGLICCFLMGLVVACAPAIGIGIALGRNKTAGHTRRALLLSLTNGLVVGLLLAVLAFGFGATIPDESAGDAALALAAIGGLGGGPLAGAITFVVLWWVGQRARTSRG